MHDIFSFLPFRLLVSQRQRRRFLVLAIFSLASRTRSSSTLRVKSTRKWKKTWTVCNDRLRERGSTIRRISSWPINFLALLSEKCTVCTRVRSSILNERTNMFVKVNFFFPYRWFTRVQNGRLRLS